MTELVQVFAYLATFIVLVRISRPRPEVSPLQYFQPCAAIALEADDFRSDELASPIHIVEAVTQNLNAPTHCASNNPPLRESETAVFRTTPVCAVCATGFEDALHLSQCSKCLTPFHRECWDYTDQCSIFGCGSRDRRNVKDATAAMERIAASVGDFSSEVSTPSSRAGASARARGNPRVSRVSNPTLLTRLLSRGSPSSGEGWPCRLCRRQMNWQRFLSRCQHCEEVVHYDCWTDIGRCAVPDCSSTSRSTLSYQETQDQLWSLGIT